MNANNTPPSRIESENNTDTEYEEFSFHCITCSDEALPATVLSVDEAGSMALVQVGAETEDVDISLVDTVSPGDVLMVHSRVALNNLGRAESAAKE